MQPKNDPTPTSMLAAPAVTFAAPVIPPFVSIIPSVSQTTEAAIEARTEAATEARTEARTEPGAEPTIEPIEFGLAGAGSTCYLVPDVLTPAQCQEAIADAERRGFAASATAYPPSYRSNDRLVIDDPSWARGLLSRVRAALPATRVDADGGVWALRRLNTRFRLCRYRPGHWFRRHRDGAFHASERERSWLTCMVYLNDADAFCGGATRFFAARDRGAPQLCSIRPRAGAAAVFDHDLWHDGAPVTAGRKYIMRTDVIYERIETPRRAQTSGGARGPQTEERAERTPVSGGRAFVGHLGYIWSVLQLRDGTLVTGGRDQTIRRWTRDGAPIATLTGHKSSVLALAEPAPGVLWSGDRAGVVNISSFSGQGARRRRAAGKLRRQSSLARAAAADDGARTARSIRAHDGAVLAIASLSSGGVATGGADGVIRVVTAAGVRTGGAGIRAGEVRLLRGHASWVWALAERADGRLVSACEDGTLAIWEPDTGRLCATFAAHDGAAESLAALPDTRSRGLIASGGADGVIALWDGARQVGRLLGHTGTVAALAAVGDGLLVSGAEDDTVRLWDIRAGRALATWRHRDFVRGLAALSDGAIASTSYDGAVSICSRPRARRRRR